MSDKPRDTICVGGLEYICVSAYEAAIRKLDEALSKLREVDSLIPKGLMFEAVLKERNIALTKIDHMEADFEQALHNVEFELMQKKARSARLVEALENARNVIMRCHDNSDSYSHRKQLLKEYREANDALAEYWKDSK